MFSSPVYAFHIPPDASYSNLRSDAVLEYLQYSTYSLLNGIIALYNSNWLGVEFNQINVRRNTDKYVIYVTTSGLFRA